jgi:hypothetical protein
MYYLATNKKKVFQKLVISQFSFCSAFISIKKSTNSCLLVFAFIAASQSIFAEELELPKKQDDMAYFHHLVQILGIDTSYSILGYYEKSNEASEIKDTSIIAFLTARKIKFKSLTSIANIKYINANYWNGKFTTSRKKYYSISQAVKFFQHEKYDKVVLLLQNIPRNETVQVNDLTRYMFIVSALRTNKTSQGIALYNIYKIFNNIELNEAILNHCALHGIDLNDIQKNYLQTEKKTRLLMLGVGSIAGTGLGLLYWGLTKYPYRSTLF